MVKARQKRGKKIMMLIAFIISVIVMLNIIGFVVNKAIFSNELESIKPYGQLVNVHGRNMHVYSMGEGEITIVLLPGSSVPLPSADFGPLMRELSKQFTVVCIEYFGVGFSDETDTPRTNDNYTEEIRTALTLAGFSPPYVLMPHSASGIYSEYYASKYPQEISSIIMLDTTSSAIKETNVPEFVYKLSKLQQATGFNRIINALVVPSLLKESNGYTKQEINDYARFLNHSFNNTIIDQNLRLNDNIVEVMGMNFPDEVSVLKIVQLAQLSKLEKSIKRII